MEFLTNLKPTLCKKKKKKRYLPVTRLASTTSLLVASLQTGIKSEIVGQLRHLSTRYCCPFKRFMDRDQTGCSDSRDLRAGTTLVRSQRISELSHCSVGRQYPPTSKMISLWGLPSLGEQDANAQTTVTVFFCPDKPNYQGSIKACP